MTLLDAPHDTLDAMKILAHRTISVVPRAADTQLSRIQQVIERTVCVDGRADLEELFGRLLERAAAGIPPVPRTLDLIGHSTSDSLLRLGDWVLDSTSRTIIAFFRELADLDVLPRLGIHAVRLLGCTTAGSERGRATMIALAEILGVEVYGTTGRLWDIHYDRDGFGEAWRFLLVAASDVNVPPATMVEAINVVPSRQALDIDRLPRVALEGERRPWPRRRATPSDARAILRLVRRTEGATMPGLLALPSCELALPAVDPAECYLAEVILDGSLLRVYPDGADRAGIAYPVSDAHALRALVDRLPIVASRG